MNSLERNNFALKNKNNIGIHNKEELISLISRNEIKKNKLRGLNTLDKNPIINNLDIKIKKSNNDYKYNNTNNNLPSKKRIVNKFIISQIKNENKKEKEFFKTQINVQNIQNLENIKTLDDKNSININNISSYKSKKIANEKYNKKKNYSMKAHHLINYLLKNQDKIPKRMKSINNNLDLSLSTSFDNNKKIDLSSSKDSLEVNNDNNKNRGELLYPNNNKKVKKVNSYNNNHLYNSLNENSIYSGENKENKDINLVNNRKDIFISPLYNLDNNNNDKYKNRNEMHKSPLKMADIFLLKKHHSLNPQLKKFLTDNNIKQTNSTFNAIKTLRLIKKENENEKSIVENIKRIQNLKVDIINIKKGKGNDGIENNKNNENKKLIKEIEEKASKENNKKENKQKIRNEINQKLNNDNKDIRKEDSNLNNRYNRNDRIRASKRKSFSQTFDNMINKASISFNKNKIDIKTLSPIKMQKDAKTIIKEIKMDNINNTRIKVNKIKLEKTKEEFDEKNTNNNEDKYIHSIRRRFMNSKNKHNNNHTPDFPNKKSINTENNKEEIKIKLTITNVHEKTISYNKIKNTIEINANNIEEKEKDPEINNEKLKNEDVENIPEIKFQSESEKENRIKRATKYKQKKEKIKEQEKKVLCVTKKEDRNSRYKLKKHNSFSFGTLFSLSGNVKQRKNKIPIQEKIIKKEEEKSKNNKNDKIINRNFSPDIKETNKNRLDIILNEKEIKIKVVNSQRNIFGTNKINLINKSKKKVIISKEIKIEEFITTKPVVRYKISELLYYNKLKDENEKQLNNNNPKKNYEIYIFGLDKNNLIKFDMRKKRFYKIKITEIEDISDSFQDDYIYENTLISNTLTGIFILTGENTNKLYYYDKKHEFIIKLCQFSSSHNSSCLLLDKNKIFILGGINNKKCEYYDFQNEKIKSIPQLNYDRANSSFCLCKNIIYSFFGFSQILKEYLFNIEYIDKDKLDKWNEIKLNVEENIIINNCIINSSLFYYEKDPNKIFIYGGKNGMNDGIIEGHYYIYDIEKNNFEKIENVVYNIKKEYKRFSTRKYQEEPKKYFFDKQKQFIELPENFDFDKNNENIGAIIDYDNNIHFLTKNRSQINLYQFLK